MDIEKIRKYKNEFDKENYKQFKAKLKPMEMEKINQFLKENNINKREFVLKAYKIEKLKNDVRKIISKFHGDTEFSIVVNLGKPIIKKLNNGILISLYTFPVLDDEKMLVIKIEFEDNILYFGTANFRLSHIIVKELEQLDTSF